MPECGEKIDEECVEFDCLYCGETDMGEGFYTCENCNIFFTFEEVLWKCEFCHDDEIMEEIEVDDSDEVQYCPECGDVLDDSEYCYNCDWSNNQGWIGENY